MLAKPDDFTIELYLTSWKRKIIAYESNYNERCNKGENT